jgi:ABC-type transporter Mla subunit MlaD
VDALARLLSEGGADALVKLASEARQDVRGLVEELRKLNASLEELRTLNRNLEELSRRFGELARLADLLGPEGGG